MSRAAAGGRLRPCRELARTFADARQRVRPTASRTHARCTVAWALRPLGPHQASGPSRPPRRHAAAAPRSAQRAAQQPRCAAALVRSGAAAARPPHCAAHARAVSAARRHGAGEANMWVARQLSAPDHHFLSPSPAFSAAFFAAFSASALASLHRTARQVSAPPVHVRRLAAACQAPPRSRRAGARRRRPQRARTRCAKHRRGGVHAPHRHAPLLALRGRQPILLVLRLLRVALRRARAVDVALRARGRERRTQRRKDTLGRARRAPAAAAPRRAWLPRVMWPGTSCAALKVGRDGVHDARSGCRLLFVTSCVRFVRCSISLRR
jgi:hypothetical protein